MWDRDMSVSWMEPLTSLTETFVSSVATPLPRTPGPYPGLGTQRIVTMISREYPWFNIGSIALCQVLADSDTNSAHENPSMICPTWYFDESCI